MNLIPRDFYLDDVFDNFLTSASHNDMKCDIYEKEGVYHIELDVPGFDKNEIKIECKNGYLNVTAEKQNEEKDESKHYIRRERKFDKYQRSFYLGDVNTDKIKAEFKHGILKVSIPKAEEIENKKFIEIE